MDTEAVAILRELVEDREAGLVVDVGERVAECAYCDGEVRPVVPDRRYSRGGIRAAFTCDHEFGCPIRRGRSLLAKLDAERGASNAQA